MRSSTHAARRRSGRSPEVHLFIEMPPDALDVNVHRRKRRSGSAISRWCTGRPPGADGRAWPQRRAAAAAAPRAYGADAVHDAAAGCPRRGRVSEPLAAGRSQGTAETAKRAEHSGCGKRYVLCDLSGLRGSFFFRRDQTHDPARAVSRHVHHRGGRRGRGDHRSARRARAGAVRTGDGAADERAARVASACSCRWSWI